MKANPFNFTRIDTFMVSSSTELHLGISIEEVKHLIEQGLENSLVLQAETRKGEEGNGEKKRGPDWSWPSLLLCDYDKHHDQKWLERKGSLWLTGPNNSASQRGAKARTQAGKASGSGNWSRDYGGLPLTGSHHHRFLNFLSYASLGQVPRDDIAYSRLWPPTAIVNQQNALIDVPTDQHYRGHFSAEVPRWLRWVKLTKTGQHILPMH